MVKTIVPPPGAVADLFYSRDKIRARELFMEIYKRHGRATAIEVFEETLNAARGELPLPTKPKGPHRPGTTASNNKMLAEIELLSLHKMWKSQNQEGLDGKFEDWYRNWSGEHFADGTIIQRLRRARQRRTV